MAVPLAVLGKKNGFGRVLPEPYSMNFTAAKTTLAGLTAVVPVARNSFWTQRRPGISIPLYYVFNQSLRIRFGNDKGGPQASLRPVTAITAGTSEGERNPR
jgi:hypothetical protein